MKNFFPVAFLLLFSFIVASTPAYAQVSLGSSSSATNPERSGDATTGLFSSTTGAVSVSSGGTEMMRVNGTGVGINTTSPQSLLTINQNASGVPTPIGSATNLQIVGANSAFSDLEMDTFGDNGVLLFVRYDGTFSSPTALQSGDAIGSLAAGGYNGSAVSSNKAGIIFSAGGTWSTTSNPTYTTFGTTAVGSTTKTERMRIDTTGNVGIGTTSPANPLTVNGVIQSTTGGVKFPDGTTQTTALTGTPGKFLLATVNAGAASSVSFGSSYITTAYNKYVVEFDGVYTSDGGALYLTFSTNNGTSYLASNYAWGVWSMGSGPTVNNASSQNQIDLTGSEWISDKTSSTSTLVSSGSLTFSSLAKAVQANVMWQTFFAGTTAFQNSGVGGFGYNTTTTAINAFQFTDGSGGTITGNFHLYGLQGT